MNRRPFTIVVLSILSILFFFPRHTWANLYLPKPGEAPIKVRLGTCSLTGAFSHIGTALDYGIFDKYGLRVKHIAFPAALQTTYEVFAKTIANRRTTASIGAIEEMIEHGRESGTQARKKAIDIVDNRFVEDLAKSGFLTELWSRELFK
jgi:hypothetical protein